MYSTLKTVNNPIKKQQRNKNYQTETKNPDRLDLRSRALWHEKDEEIGNLQKIEPIKDDKKSTKEKNVIENEKFVKTTPQDGKEELKPGKTSKNLINNFVTRIALVAMTVAVIALIALIIDL